MRGMYPVAALFREMAGFLGSTWCICIADNSVVCHCIRKESPDMSIPVVSQLTMLSLCSCV